MRKIFVILGVLFYVDAIAATDAPIQNFSLGASEYSKNDELALDEYRAVAEFQAELINSELAEISARIKSLNPELYNQMQSKPPMEQLYAYRSWLAHESFDWYKIRLIEDIKLKSANTGRHIKTANGKNQDRIFQNTVELDNYIASNCEDDICEFWLDRGKYDTAECYAANGFRETGICEYALNFEEYTLLLTTESISLIRGNAAQNTFEIYDIILVRDEQNFDLDINYSVGDLAEFIEYENKGVRLHSQLETLTGRDRKDFIKQYNQALKNGNIDTTLPSMTVGGIGVSGTFNQ